MASPGKSFNPDAPAFSASNASVIVATPGSMTSPSFAARSITARSALGETTSLRASLGDFVDLMRLKHRAGADENPFAEAKRDSGDAGERLGRVERNLDRAKAGLDNCPGDRLGFVRPDAAQDRDERRRRELERHRRPPSRAMRKSPRAAARGGAAWATPKARTP